MYTKNNINNNFATIYVVRHGQTEWNVKKIFQGQKDSPLTTIGVEQAKAVAAGFKDIEFDGIFSSDLLRARRTAEIIALERDILVKTNVLLREQNYGELEGRYIDEAMKELRHKFEEYESLADQERFNYSYVDDMESDAQVVERFLIFLSEVTVAYRNKSILIVSHGSLMSSFLVKIGFWKQDRIKIKNTGYFKMHADGKEFKILETEGVLKE